LKQIALAISHNSRSELKQIALAISHNSLLELKQKFIKKNIYTIYI